MEKKTEMPNVLGVALLHKCNFNCSHCGYLYTGENDDHGIKPDYRLKWEQIMALLEDCKKTEEMNWAFIINGGEPTLWEEGDLGLIDVLLETQKAGVRPAYNTNGSYFTEPTQCCDFFHKYADNAEMPLMTAVSIDDFHDNFDREKGRAESLDNIIEVLDEMPAEKREMHRVHVITIVTKDPASALPPEMKTYYEAKGITFGDFPLQPIGRAKKLMDRMPDPPESMKSGPNMAYEMTFANVIGDYYTRHGKNVAKLGCLKDLVDESCIPRFNSYKH